MSDRLDHLMARLAATPTDRRLDDFDDEVSRGIARHRDDARTASALRPARLASISLALAIGVTAGGVAAAFAASEPRQLNTFSVHAHLAPSTLLEGGR